VKIQTDYVRSFGRATPFLNSAHNKDIINQYNVIWHKYRRRSNLSRLFL